MSLNLVSYSSSSNSESDSGTDSTEENEATKPSILSLPRPSTKRSYPPNTCSPSPKRQKLSSSGLDLPPPKASTATGATNAAAGPRGYHDDRDRGEESDDDWVPGLQTKQRTAGADTSSVSVPDASSQLLSLLPAPKAEKDDRDEAVRGEGSEDIGLDLFGLAEKSAEAGSAKANRVLPLPRDLEGGLKPAGNARRMYQTEGSGIGTGSAAASTPFVTPGALVADLDDASRTKIFGRHVDPTSVHIPSVDSAQYLGTTAEERAVMQERETAKSVYRTKGEDVEVPTYHQRRKHQMSSLIHDARVRERELADRNARVLAGRRLNRQRYGF